jgi:hypothetical protein
MVCIQANVKQLLQVQLKKMHGFYTKYVGNVWLFSVLAHLTPIRAEFPWWMPHLSLEDGKETKLLSWDMMQFVR